MTPTPVNVHHNTHHAILNDSNGMMASQQGHLGTVEHDAKGSDDMVLP